jgi:hypothetical protein
MPRRPNYRFERAERDRLKRAKKDEKAKRQQERATVRQDDAPSDAGEQKDPPTET